MDLLTVVVLVSIVIGIGALVIEDRLVKWVRSVNIRQYPLSIVIATCLSMVVLFLIGWLFTGFGFGTAVMLLLEKVQGA